MVRPDGRVVILDFRLMSDALPSTPGPDEPMGGTPANLAPEQHAGGHPSEATDWYAAGVTLCEVLTGRLPFEGTARCDRRNLRDIGETRSQHAGHAGGVLDVLRGHPLLGLSPKLAPRRVVLQRADSAPGDGGVQASCRRGRIDRRRRGGISGPVEYWPSRYAIPARSSKAIGSDHGIRSLAMRRAPARATARNRRELLFLAAIASALRARR